MLKDSLRKLESLIFDGVVLLLSAADQFVIGVIAQARIPLRGCLKRLPEAELALYTERQQFQ